jgi:hypothetical protein
MAECSAAPMRIASYRSTMIRPDTKDWTWVLERPCPDCGYNASEVGRDRVGELLLANLAAWEPLLIRAGAAVRPDEDTWSALEYGCHVRDVLRLFAVRLQLMLDEDGAAFANWDQDATAVEDDYGAQDPAVVLADLTAAGAALADRFDSVADGQWSRTGVRSDGAHFTVESFAKYLLHDPTHHVWDVERGYSSTPQRRRS